MFKPIYLLTIVLLSCGATTSSEPAANSSNNSFQGEQEIDKTTLEILSPNKTIKTSDIRITLQLPSGFPKPIWDGVKKYPVPDYGMESKWIISYKDSAFGEWEHSRLVVDGPVAYKFVFNRNRDSSMFVQAIARGGAADYSNRIQLLPKQ